MSGYEWIRLVHMTAAAASISGFVLRGCWRLVDSPWLAARPVRIAPHVIDTILLGAALALAGMSGQWPFVHAWLTAKVLALLAYIGLGMLTLKARDRRLQAGAFVAAVATFGYIVAVAMTRRVWPLG